MHKRPDLRPVILDFLSEENSSDLLHRFGDLLPSKYELSQGHSATEVCLATYHETMTKVHQQLVVFLVSLGLHGLPQHSKIGDALTILLNKQTRLSNAPSLGACTACNVTRHRSALSLFETDSTPEALSISHNWRDNVVRALSRDANHQYDSIVRMVGEICRDLEARCEEAERPFREEQSKSRELADKLKASATETCEVEAQLMSQTAVLGGVRNERDSLLREVDAAEQRSKDQARDLEKCRLEFDQAHRDAELAAQAAMVQSRERDLAYLATLTGKEEIIDEQHTKLVASDDRISELEDELGRHREQVAKDTMSIRTHETSIAELHKNMLEIEEMDAARQAQIDSLLNSEADLMCSKDELTDKLQEVVDQHKSVVAGHESDIQTAETLRKELQQKHSMYQSDKEAKIRRLEGSHKSSCDRWQAELEEARKRAAITNEQSTICIDNLKTKIKKLHKEAERQAKEFAEVQEASSKFMKVMGNTHHFTAPLGKRSRPSRFGVKDLPSDDEHDAEEMALDQDSSISSREGVTPKRSKPHQASQTVAAKSRKRGTYTTLAQKSRSGDDNGTKVPRTPLTELKSTPNLSNVTPTQRIIWDKSRLLASDEKHSQGETIDQGYSDDESFDGRNLFTSTDQQQLSALRKKQSPPLPRDTFNETTAEF